MYEIKDFSEDVMTSVDSVVFGSLTSFLGEGVRLWSKSAILTLGRSFSFVWQMAVVAFLPQTQLVSQKREVI